jgi:hypothetical protein
VWQLGRALGGGAVQGSCRLPGTELPALPLQKIQLRVTSARAFTSPRMGLCVETVQSLAEVAGTGLLGAATAGAGQGGGVLLNAQLLIPLPTKTWQAATIARVGTSLLTRLHVATRQSLVGVVGTEFLLGTAAAGAG